MPSLSEIRSRLYAHRPQRLDLGDLNHAAVALVLREATEGPEVLFIERAHRDGDPWSGHMALPGGRVDPDDRGGRSAAERETFEEVGLSLAGAERVGRLDDKQGSPRSDRRLVISAYVYATEGREPLAPNHEVQQAFWFPLRGLHDPERHVHYEAAEMHFPGILVGEPGRHIVWGLTYSFLESFFHAVGKPLPNRWSEELASYSRRQHESE